jgi:hypothetical protein
MQSALVETPTSHDGAPPRKYRWPESEFFVSEPHRLVYCPIQKIACSSLKLWWAELVDGSSAPFITLNETGQPVIDHFALNARYKLHHQPPELGRRPLTEDGWLRVVFVRNPWARLVSAFVNKFVPFHDLAKPVFEEVHRQQWNKALRRMPGVLLGRLAGRGGTRRGLGRIPDWPWHHDADDWQDEMSFVEFVDYLAGCNLDAGKIDPHWSPQYRFLGDTAFNFVGRFEHLENDVRTLARLLDTPIQLPAVNRTAYSRRFSRSFADCPLKRLRRLPSMPDYRQFYTPPLRERVARLYRRDIEMCGYEFND